MKVRLRVADGGLVHEAEIPLFNKDPDVLVWGARIFCRYSDGAEWKHGDYREAFAWAMVDERPTRPMPASSGGEGAQTP